MSVAGEKKQKQKRDRQYLLISRAGMIVLLLGMFGWFARGMLPEAALFLGIGAVYAAFVWRIASQSVRAFNVMLWSLLLNYWTLIPIDNHHLLGVPAAGPWFLGMLVGGMAGGFIWLGPHAGARFVPKHRRKPDADGQYPGGRRPALLNAACTVLLLGIGAADIALLSPTMAAAAVLAASFIAGWILFRFSPALPVRNGLLLLGLPVGFVVLGFLGGATGSPALPGAGAYGILAGILIGGRYWSGVRFGAPRPPFNSQYKRRRRKRRARSSAIRARAAQR